MGVVAGGVHRGRSGCVRMIGAQEVLRGDSGEMGGRFRVQGGGVLHFEVLVFVVVFGVVVIGWGGGAYGARSGGLGLVGDGEVGGAVGGFEVGDALFEVAEVVDACLEDGELVHFLVAAGGDHIL